MGSSSESGRVTNVELREALARQEARLERIEKDIVEIKETVTCSDERVRAIEKQEAGRNPLTDNRIEQIEKRLEKHDEQIAELTKNVESLHQTVKVVTWVCGIAGAAIITWLIAQLLALI
jgi:archaellum component FlaC